MKKNIKIIQLILAGIGFFLILVTYFLYPEINKNQTYESKIETENIIKKDNSLSNSFENVEYKGFYNITKPFIVKSEKAYILKKDSNVVYMQKMHVTLDMKDGRFINITSDKGSYNKVNYDLFFEVNVRVIDDKTQMLADNLELLASKDTATIYNNVYLYNNNGSLRADKITYDLQNKQYKVSMLSDKKVKIKVIE